MIDHRIRDLSHSHSLPFISLLISFLCFSKRAAHQLVDWSCELWDARRRRVLPCAHLRGPSSSTKAIRNLFFFLPVLILVVLQAGLTHPILAVCPSSMFPIHHLILLLDCQASPLLAPVHSQIPPSEQTRLGGCLLSDAYAIGRRTHQFDDG